MHYVFRHPAAELEAVIDPPADLAGESAEIWQGIARELAESSRLTARNRELLASYCHSIATWRRAMAIIAQEGDLVPSVRGMKPNPLFAVAFNAINRALGIAASFGLTPLGERWLAGPRRDAEREDQRRGVRGSTSKMDFYSKGNRP